MNLNKSQFRRRSHRICIKSIKSFKRKSRFFSPPESFSIKVPDNVTKLVVSYIGMEEQEVAIGKSPLTIVLKEIGQKMDEVVLLVMGPKRRPILQDLFQTLPRKN